MRICTHFYKIYVRNFVSHVQAHVLHCKNHTLVIIGINRISLVLSIVILYLSFSSNILFLSKLSHSNSLLFIYFASISASHKQAFLFLKVMKIIFFFKLFKGRSFKGYNYYNICYTICSKKQLKSIFFLNGIRRVNLLYSCKK